MNFHSYLHRFFALQRAAGLLPKDALAPFALIESRAHALVESATFPFLGGIGRFLPNTKLKEVTERLHELEVDFIQAHHRFHEQYERLRDSAIEEWSKADFRLCVS